MKSTKVWAKSKLDAYKKAWQVEDKRLASLRKSLPMGTNYSMVESQRRFLIGEQQKRVNSKKAVYDLWNNVYSQYNQRAK